jgi:hypothetical protein
MSELYRPHCCNLPYPYPSGIIWRCDECGRIWRSSYPGNPAYAKWYRLGPILRWFYRASIG